MFDGPFRLELVDELAAEGRGTWEGLADFGFHSQVAGRLLVVPAGFVSDLASVPRVPGVFDLLGDRFHRAAYVHDWLYTAHPVDRETADRVLREAILASGGSVEQADAYFAGVRLGGWRRWGAVPGK